MDIRCYLRHAWLAIFTTSFLYPLPISTGGGAYAGEIVTHEIESPAIANNTMGISSKIQVSVYLPDGYAKKGERYPVLYYLSGWGGGTPIGEFNIDLLDGAIKTGKLPPTIAVFVNAWGTIFLNSAEFGYWEDFVSQELISFIDKTYRTIPRMSKRGLIGFSVGGYAAMVLLLLQPAVWGAVGSNDGSAWISCSNPGGLPDNIDGYKTAGSRQQIYIQVGVAISPNPATPLRFDMPATAPPEKLKDVQDKWSTYCLRNPAWIAKYRETLSKLLMIAVVVPEQSDGTNRSQNITMIEHMKTAGISVTLLERPGGHGSFEGERFIDLAEQVLKALGGVISVEAKGKLPITWGEIKRGKY